MNKRRYIKAKHKSLRGVHEWMIDTGIAYLVKATPRTGFGYHVPSGELVVEHKIQIT
jgi:hypothetical protein